MVVSVWLTGGRRLLCANLADPALAGAARSRGPATVGAAGMSAKHGPPHAACGCGAAPAASPGLSAEHGPLRATCGCCATPGLLAKHEPLRVARGCGTAPGLSARHTPSFLEMHLRGECISAHTHKPSLRALCSFLTSQASIAQKLSGSLKKVSQRPHSSPSLSHCLGPNLVLSM
jgi:hypothetical protein